MIQSNYIDFVKLYLYEGLSKNESFTLFSETMVRFFGDVPTTSNYTDLDYFCNRPNPEPLYLKILEQTKQLSGVNDRRTDAQGNDFWVETTELMGD